MTPDRIVGALDGLKEKQRQSDADRLWSGQKYEWVKDLDNAAKGRLGVDLYVKVFGRGHINAGHGPWGTPRPLLNFA
jgi:hypothetical protein